MLQIVHINDTDSTDPDSWAPAADLIRSLRRDGAVDLLVHAGDITLGAATGQAIVDRLERLGFDAFALGNHDFDGGADILLEQIALLSDRALCANVSGFVPFRLMAVKGVRVALVGVVLGDLVLLQPEGNLAGVAVTPPAEALVRLIPGLREIADLVILLSHCGLDADRQLAGAVPGIDLIVGGHSHHLLTAPERVGQTWIVQAGAFGQQVGLVTVTADGAGGWRVEGRVAATGAHDLAHAAPAPPDYARETAQGNLTTDVMRAFARTDLSLLRCSSVNLASPAPDDPAALNFCAGDQVVTLELTGADLRTLLECGARDAYYLLTLSGGAVRYDGRRPQGERVTGLTVGGAEVEPDRWYTVACSEILARGAAGFTLMQGRPYRPTGASIADLLRARRQAGNSSQPALDGRLAIDGALPREPR